MMMMVVMMMMKIYRLLLRYVFTVRLPTASGHPHVTLGVRLSVRPAVISQKPNKKNSR